jgi:hypothetical protein
LRVCRNGGRGGRWVWWRVRSRPTGRSAFPD